LVRVVKSFLFTTTELARKHAPCNNKSSLILSRSFLARNPNEVAWHTDCGYSSAIVYIGGQDNYSGGELEFQDPASGEDLTAAVSLQPKDGDVVLFHTSLYHRVKASRLGDRPTAMICFSEDERYFEENLV
jgi:ectoine hydroxylase-related dioxygenase (phytanoyl-CoA dioxygenase family)